ncbi:hypothetical protein ACTXT7_001849 [Hymenolepis weldensis]
MNAWQRSQDQCRSTFSGVDSVNLPLQDLRYRRPTLKLSPAPQIILFYLRFPVSLSLSRVSTAVTQYNLVHSQLLAL